MNTLAQESRCPKLSIVTVTYNAGDELSKTLGSILGQTYTDFELIIIDGGSTDNTVDIIKRHQDRIGYWVSEKDAGIYDAMNKALVAARGEYVQFLNAGDYFINHEVLSLVFSNAPSSAFLIYGDIEVKHLNGRTTNHPASAFTLDNLLRKGTGVLCHQAMFVKRECAPLYNLKYRFKGELNWYFDLVELDGFTYHHISAPLVTYTMGGFGYKCFLRNRLDWLKVVYDRYGLKTIYDSMIIIFLLKNSMRRYPWLARLAKIVNYPRVIFNKNIRHIKR